MLFDRFFINFFRDLVIIACYYRCCYTFRCIILKLVLIRYISSQQIASVTTVNSLLNIIENNNNLRTRKNHPSPDHFVEHEVISRNAMLKWKGSVLMLCIINFQVSYYISCAVSDPEGHGISNSSGRYLTIEY